MIFACGSAFVGSASAHNRCEIYQINQNIWTNVDKYPFELGSDILSVKFFFAMFYLISTEAELIWQAAVINHEDAFYSGIRIFNLFL